MDVFSMLLAYSGRALPSGSQNTRHVRDTIKGSSGNSDAVEVRIEGPPEPLRTTSRPIAGSVDQQLVVKAVSPGKVNIRLTQRRSWERDKPPLAEQSLPHGDRAGVMVAA
jgi:hypothetical protein